jgi:hypothetical protein
VGRDAGGACLLCILSEEWEHRLYAERDLDALKAPPCLGGITLHAGDAPSWAANQAPGASGVPPAGLSAKVGTKKVWKLAPLL